MHLKHPEHEAESLRLNATNILKVLGLANISQAEAKKATKWLRANGYRAVHQGKVFRVALAYPQTAASLMVL